MPHTGDVTGSTALTIANSAVTTDKIANSAVTNDKMAEMPPSYIKGNYNYSGLFQAPADLSVTQVQEMLGLTLAQSHNAIGFTATDYTTSTIDKVLYTVGGYDDGNSAGWYYFEADPIDSRGGYYLVYLNQDDIAATAYNFNNENLRFKDIDTYGGSTSGYNFDVAMIHTDIIPNDATHYRFFGYSAETLSETFTVNNRITLTAPLPGGSLNIGAGGTLDTGAFNPMYVHPENHPAGMITTSNDAMFVTQTEKTTWDSKASTAIATTSVNGLMSKNAMFKLSGIDVNANNYTHPDNHAPSIITQDANNRFVTDTEKNTWNNKASTSCYKSVNGLMSTNDKSKLNGIAAGANNYTASR